MDSGTKQAMCRGKKDYRTYWQARRAAKWLNRKGNRVGPYRCHSCGFYHVGESISGKGRKTCGKTATDEDYKIFEE